MADKKFEKDLDRQATLYDAKIRIIDLMANGFELPDTGIYDEPVRYFKANLKWTPIIFGWLSWLEDVAGWPDAEDETYRGIQEILTFEEGIDLTLSDDISNGIYKALNDLAKQIVSGRTTNISVDEDGTVSDPTGDLPADDLPEDDPETLLNEKLAAQYGGSLGIALGVRIFLNHLFTLFGADTTPDTALADAVYIVSNAYVVEAGIGTAMDAYWTERAAGNAQITTVDREDLANHLFCNPFMDSKAAVSQFIADLGSFTVSQRQICTDLIQELEETQFNIWYQTGAAAPSTEYLAAPCTKAAVEEFDLDMSTANNVQYTTNATYQAGHRLLIEPSGSFVDSDVPNTVQDFFYSVNTLTNVKTYLPSQYQINGAGITEPVQAQVPYQSSHNYAITVDTTTVGTIVFGRDNDAFTIPNVTGILHLKITDLGMVV